MSVVWTGSQLMAVGKGGAVLTSPDGVTWTAKAQSANTDFNAVAWTGSIYVAAVYYSLGAGYFFVSSPDGVTWSDRGSTDAVYFIIKGADNQLYGVGGSGVNGGIIYTSPNGLNVWNTVLGGIGHVLRSVATNASVFVAVGDSGVFSTVSGASTVGGNLYSVVWTGKQFVSVGASGGILVSLDGAAWATRSAGTSSNLTSVAWTGGQFVAVAADGTILTSLQDPAPSAPVLNAPAQNAVGVATSPGLTWNASSGAVYYRLQVATNSTFSVPLVDDSSLTVTRDTVYDLPGNTVCYWRVNARNAGGTSVYSEVRSFTTVVGMPNILNVYSDTGTPVSTHLSWEAVSGAISYRIQVSTNSAFSSLRVDDSTLTTTSKIASGLLNNTTYYWRVNAKGASGTGAWSGPWDFITPTAAPTLKSPAQNSVALQNATGAQIATTLGWNAVTGATYYHLQLSANPNFTSLLVDDSLINTTTRVVESLALNKVYYWRVSARNNSGSSAYSAVWNFTTPSVAQSAWSLRNSGVSTAISLRSVVWTGSLFVAVGGTSSTNSLVTSPDGASWVTRSAGSSNSYTLYSVAWTGSQLVAVGDRGTIQTSPDGITWTKRTLGTGATDSLRSVVWTGSQLVAVGVSGVVQISSDGVTWTKRTSVVTKTLNSVIWTGSQLVAWGVGGTLVTSPDAVTWTAQTSGTTRGVSSVVWTGSQFVAVGDSGAVLTSLNGTTWTSQNSGTKKRFNSVIWTGSKLMTVGDSGTIALSTDGIAWTLMGSATPNPLYSVVSTSSQYVAVGGSGTIITAPLLPVALGPHFSSSENLSLRLTQSQLFVALPNSMLGQSVRAVIYSTGGKKLDEVHVSRSNDGIYMPIGKFARGVYLLEVSVPNRRIVQAFSVMR